MKKREISDMTMILIAMLLGSLAGIIIGKSATYTGFIGDTWLNLMKMLSVSIVVCMLVKGISSIDSSEALGRIGTKITAFYIFTTICVGVLGTGATSILSPGSGFSYEAVAEEIVIDEMPTIAELSKSTFSSNILATFPPGDMMRVVIISCIIGVVIVLLPEGEEESVRGWPVVMSDLVMSTINITLRLAPVGVFCPMTSSLGKYGVRLLVTIGRILGTFYLCRVLYLTVIYRLLLWMLTGISPITSIREAFNTLATAASTYSGNAVTPASVEIATQNFGCNESMTSLGVPPRATVNKDGAIILCGVVPTSSGWAVRIPLIITQTINILFVMALVISTGSGVPGGGLVNLMIVGTAVGMPLDIALMVGGFYHFFDMGTTSMSCPGDMSATVAVDRLKERRTAELEKKLQR